MMYCFIRKISLLNGNSFSFFQKKDGLCIPCCCNKHRYQANLWRKENERLICEFCGAKKNIEEIFATHVEI